MLLSSPLIYIYLTEKQCISHIWHPTEHEKAANREHNVLQFAAFNISVVNPYSPRLIAS